MPYASTLNDKKAEMARRGRLSIRFAPWNVSLNMHIADGYNQDPIHASPPSPHSVTMTH